MTQPSLAGKTLSELSTDIFLSILRIQRTPDVGSFETLHPAIQQLFQAFEQNCKAQSIDADDVSNARYALAAFMDETVLNSHWPYKDRWADNPLQLEYFGTYLAGEIFFDKLDQIRAQTEAKSGLLEIYYFCLLLGFKGKYGVSGLEKLHSLTESVGAELNRTRAGRAHELAPHWKVPDGPQGPVGDRLPGWVVYTCWGLAAFAVVLYLVLFFKVRHDADSLREAVQSQTAVRVDGYGPERAGGVWDGITHNARRGLGGWFRQQDPGFGQEGIAGDRLVAL
ncbi:MAG: type IVB secretion system protein IcmH/DotU [Acidobacteriota bacterium]